MEVGVTILGSDFWRGPVFFVTVVFCETKIYISLPRGTVIKREFLIRCREKLGIITRISVTTQNM